MALSNRTLSGCLDPIFASGLTDFLLVQAVVISSNVPSTAMNENRRDMNTSNCSRRDSRLGCPAERISAILTLRLAGAPLPSQLSAAPAPSFLDRRYRTLRYPQPEFPRPPQPLRSLRL